MAKGDPRAALGDLNRVVEEGASHTRVYFMRAAVRQSLRDAVGAREDYQQGMTLTPSDSMSWIARGMAQLKRSPERALSDFQRALNLDPGNRSALQNILHVLTERLDRPEEALALLDDQIVSHPDDFRALATRAVIHARRGSADLAVADAEQALKLNQDPKMLLQIACAYANLASSDPQHEERALELCARALGSDPQLAARAAADVDLQPIRSTAEFQRILRAAKVIENGGRDVDSHVAIP
jgi:tetratricopeptide (TPR) repeat protein